MRLKRLTKVIVLSLMLAFSIMLAAGCGKSMDDLTEKIDGALENSESILPSDEEISESMLYSCMQFYYRYAYNYGIDAPIFKERNKVASYTTQINYENNKDKLIYVDCDSGYFSGDSYTMTLEESEYAYWGDLNDEGKPDGIGVIFRAFTSFDPDNPELFLLYMGQFSDGYYDGYGVEFNFPDIYNDVPNYVGALITEDNVSMYNDPIYEGYFKKGQYSGEGVKILCNIGAYDIDTGELQLDPEKADYYLYIGNFKKGELDGDDVKVYNYKGVLEYEGEFSGGEYNGEGILYYIDHPGQVKYKGEFSGGEFQGDGILYDENGDVIYEGEFLRGDIA